MFENNIIKKNRKNNPPTHWEDDLHKTKVGSNAFIGSNSSLIAPLVVGKNSMIGAGSVITKNVSENKLALSRSKQRNIKKK